MGVHSSHAERHAYRKIYKGEEKNDLHVLLWIRFLQGVVDLVREKP